MRRSVLTEKGNGLKQAERCKGVKEKEVGYSSSEEESPSSISGCVVAKGSWRRWEERSRSETEQEKAGSETARPRSGDKRDRRLSTKWPWRFLFSERSLVGLAGCFGGAEASTLAAQKNRPHAERLLAGWTWSHDLDSEEETP